jgi:hypothetical protein
MLAPTLQPIVQPTTVETEKQRPRTKNIMSWPALGCLALALSMIGVVAILRCRRMLNGGVAVCQSHLHYFDRNATELVLETDSLPEEPWLRRDASDMSDMGEPWLRQDASDMSDIKEFELGAHSVMKSHESSPAPAFAVCCKSERIALWSPGMAATAPMVGDPVGSLLSDLPFVDARDLLRLRRFLRRITDGSGERDPTQTTFMLHLLTEHMQSALFEMVGTLIRGFESLVVLTGRHVDPGLAGLIVCDSETNSVGLDMNDDRSLPVRSQEHRSAPQAGSDPTVYSDDGKADSIVSSLTTPSLQNEEVRTPSSAPSNVSAHFEMVETVATLIRGTDGGDGGDSHPPPSRAQETPSRALRCPDDGESETKWDVNEDGDDCSLPVLSYESRSVSQARSDNDKANSNPSILIERLLEKETRQLSHLSPTIQKPLRHSGDSHSYVELGDCLVAPPRTGDGLLQGGHAQVLGSSADAGASRGALLRRGEAAWPCT